MQTKSSLLCNFIDSRLIGCFEVKQNKKALKNTRMEIISIRIFFPTQIYPQLM